VCNRVPVSTTKKRLGEKQRARSVLVHRAQVEALDERRRRGRAHRVRRAVEPAEHAAAERAGRARRPRLAAGAARAGRRGLARRGRVHLRAVVREVRADEVAGHERELAGHDGRLDGERCQWRRRSASRASLSTYVPQTCVSCIWHYAICAQRPPVCIDAVPLRFGPG
jgi:hypothetical protein